MFKLDLEKAEEPNYQHPLDHQESKKVPEKHLLLLYWVCQSLWLCGSQQTGKFLKRWEYQTTFFLRNLYAGQEATVRTGHETTDWFQIGKRVGQGCILSPCWFNLYAEYTMRNAGLEKAQAGIKIAGRNINKLRYADDTTIMAESKELSMILLINYVLNVIHFYFLQSPQIFSWHFCQWISLKCGTNHVCPLKVFP